MFLSFKENSWKSFVLDHSNLSLAQACLATVSPHTFWPISDQYPDLACRLHVQIRLMGNYGLNGGITGITNTDDALRFVCKRDTETVGHFLFDCPDFREPLAMFTLYRIGFCSISLVAPRYSVNKNQCFVAVQKLF